MAWTIASDSAELAIEVAAEAARSGLAVIPHISASPIDEALSLIKEGGRVAVLCLRSPLPEQLVALSMSGARPPIATLDSPSALALDLGLPTVRGSDELAALIALHDTSVVRPWEASSRGLHRADRERLRAFEGAGSHAHWVSTDDHRVALAWSVTDQRQEAIIGRAAVVARALASLRDAEPLPRPRMPRVEGVDPEAVLGVILGPPRALSDPASKAALAAYDVPLPQEVLCTSPSRAASEAAALGFPVRLALASPDLRLWDHPDLVADGVDNATRVRDVFRQMMALGKARAGSRLLGVTVSATTSSRALMWLDAAPLREGLVRAELGFADPHGLAADDRTELLLPATQDSVERALHRLQGHALLLGSGESNRVREEILTHLTDLLLRVGAFVNEWRAEIEGVRIQPLAVLVGGRVEARDACVRVGDAFARSLQAGGGL